MKSDSSTSKYSKTVQKQVTVVELDHKACNSSVLQTGDTENLSTTTKAVKFKTGSMVYTENEENFRSDSGTHSETDEMCQGKALNRDALQKEVVNLKELLVLHLDLIQQQQQSLVAKDRIIKTLTGEKDALRRRLERMERRMVLVKQSPVKPKKVPPTYAQPSERGIKRKASTDFQPESTASQVSIPQPIPELRKAGLPELRKGSEAFEHKVPGKRGRKPRVQENLPVKEKFVLKDYTKSTDKDKILRTDQCYYVPFYDLEEEETEETVVVPKASDVVEVPSWRLNKLTNRYAIEGTEEIEANELEALSSSEEHLDDDIYLKRHQKLEHDERRRKRWDMQRLRELRSYEKLKRNYENCKQNQPKGGPKVKDRSPIKTFCPSLDNIRFLEISDDIPVCAFGCTVPAVDDAEFNVPWVDKNKVPPEFKKKNFSTRNSRR